MDYDGKVAVRRSIWLSDWRPLAAALAIGSFWLMVYVDNRTSTLDPVINFLSPIIYIGVVICAPMISLWGAVRALTALIRVRPNPGRAWFSLAANIGTLLGWYYTAVNSFAGL
jgi:hypothetical protein